MNVAERSHLSIGEVLSLLQDEFPDVTISKIRFLESQGLLDPERTPSGYRKFYEADVRRLRWILTEQRDKFLPLKVIKDRLDDGVEAELAAPDTAGNGAFAAVPPAAGPPPEPATTPAPATAPPPASAPTATPSLAKPAAGPGQPAPPAPAAPAVATEPASPPAEPAPLPIWMADAARAKVDRGRTGRPPVGEEGPDPLAQGPTSVSLTADELLAASGLTRLQLSSLEEYGLVRGHAVADGRYYDGEDLVIAQKSAGFLSRGIEARHLRMFKTAAEREAALLESLVMPLVKQRNAEGQQQAHDTVVELASLAQGLRAAFLRAALSDQL
ncbi:MAG TPA: MerR family transcriptional regulator [Iamia sp.]|nr:MerR family transcriptional regulator [Iamia sp.]